jgi:hypothetical protein
MGAIILNMPDSWPFSLLTRYANDGSAEKDFPKWGISL